MALNHEKDIMRAKVVDYRTVKPPIAGIPHGTYKGVWGGYTVRVTVDHTQFELKTDVGIRTPNADCVVTSGPDGVFVEATP